jgi:hypothetical protein
MPASLRSFAAAEVTSSSGSSRIRHATRVVRDAQRTRRDSQQHVAELQAQNDQLRIGLRQVQMHHAAQPLTSPAPPQKEIPSQARQNAPTLLRLVLALLIGMRTGVILLL